MVIRETPVFTRQITTLMPDEMYRKLQEALIRNPLLGDEIPGSGGLRKVRWRLPGRGKRGGARIIYFWIRRQNHIYMLAAFSKSDTEDLSKAQLEILRDLVRRELGGDED